MYARISPGRTRIERVVLLGPAHRVLVDGIAAPSAARFRTPLGDVDVDLGAIGDALELPHVTVSDPAHASEHCLEVQLPFLQLLLDRFTIVPLLVGEAEPLDVTEVLDRLWGGDEALILVSSDLSHHHDYETAQRIDGATATAIRGLDPAGLTPGSACGRIPIAGLLHAARNRGMRCETVSQCNSGDTGGPLDNVVGYGAFAFTEPERGSTA
jgi:AmmeMemoRadiSam system protein B